MNKIDGQNEIFEMIKTKYRKQELVDEKEIYKILTDFGFTNEDRQVRKRKHLLDFKGEIKERGIILDDEKVPFIPFASYDASNEELETAIKMYIPVDAKHLRETQDFLSEKIQENDIKTNSKARNRVTSDDIVIRVFDIKSAEKVRSIVRESKVKDNIKFSNPFFAHDELGIGYAMDGLSTSYNNELSKLLASFVSSRNSIDEINRDNFKKYLHDKKTDSYRNNPDKTLFYPESDRIRDLIEMSMDEEFDFTEMMKYASLIHTFKDNLKTMNIRDLSSLVFTELYKTHNLDDVINMMGNIEKLKEDDFESSFVHMLSKIYLTGELSIDYLSSLNREEIEKNGPKHM